MRGFVFIFSLILIPAALVQTIHAQQAEYKNSGLPWAYGFETSAMVPTSSVSKSEIPAPAEEIEDRQSLKYLPGSTLAFDLQEIDYTFRAVDWYPNDHPLMPEVVAHGRKPSVRACGFCHYPNGKGRPNNAGLAGLPAFYIMEQLRNFKEGDRKSWDSRKPDTFEMIAIASNMTKDEMQTAAQYFSSVKWTPWIKVVETDAVPKSYFVGAGGLRRPAEGAQAGTEPIGRRIIELPANVEQTNLRDPRSGFIAYVPTGSISRGKFLATTGGSGKTIGCANCHGDGLIGGDFDVPPIAGRSPSYLARQLYDFQKGTRADYTRLMTQTVSHLTEDDILDIVAYVASLPTQGETRH